MQTLKDKLTAKIKTPKISALEWLNQSSLFPLLDVRSEGEFQEGHIPGSISAPILNNNERHQVGLTYKNKGQEAAITLGIELVEPHKQERLKNWLSQIDSRVAVTCWRGGLRSRFASGWLEEVAGDKIEIVQITGGYKALRRELINTLNKKREMWVLGGMTGSGKTALLKEMQQEGKIPSDQILDLERMARHRGSAFGNYISKEGEKEEQPRQQTFENRMGLQLFKAQGAIILENESTLIGKVFIPQTFKQQMKLSPLVILEAPLSERVSAIFEEYIKNPIDSGCSSEKLWPILESNIKALEKRLGGKETTEALRLVTEGKPDPLNLEKQTPWIELLLTRYYDKGYAQALKNSKQTVVFRGTKNEVKAWLTEKVLTRMP